MEIVPVVVLAPIAKVEPTAPSMVIELELCSTSAPAFVVLPMLVVPVLVPVFRFVAPVTLRPLPSMPVPVKLKFPV